MKNELSKPKGGHICKFVIMSLIGVFLFMVPIPHMDGVGGFDAFGVEVAGGGFDAYGEAQPGNRVFNIPLGFAINWVGENLNTIPFGDYGLLYLLAAAAITISFIMSIIAYTVKPAFIMESERLRSLFQCGIVYLISKAVGFAFVWMVFFDIGPAPILDIWDGGGLMMSLISGNGGLMAIFIVIGLAIPLLTDFGIMEFLGILIKKVVRALFTLPGRSSIDLLGSWFSSSAGAVIITRNQHEKGFYTGREAAAICVNFTLVSLPFTFVVANFIGLLPYFALFYLAICLTSIILAMIMPRIWPLRGIKDEYLPEVGKQIDEDVPENVSMLKQAVTTAGLRASQTGPVDVIKSGASNWLSIFMDLIPVILAWGTIALVINATTPIFQWISTPFGWFMQVLRVPDAMYYAPATVVGFVDMFIPAVMLGTGAPHETRFIIGALSIVQIIYMAETGILILKSKIPLHIGHLLVLFVMRTILALPLIVLFYRIIF